MYNIIVITTVNYHQLRKNYCMRKSSNHRTNLVYRDVDKTIHYMLTLPWKLIMKIIIVIIIICVCMYVFLLYL